MAERRIRCSVFARLPNDFHLLTKATDQGAPLSKSNGNSLGGKFHELACRLAGMSTVPEEKPGVLANLFSSISTARKNQGSALPVKA